MKRDDLLRYAKDGAAKRLLEINIEAKGILKLFPGLKPSASTAVTIARSAAAPDIWPTAGAKAGKKKRRKMSAKARKAISAAQKARWAKQKAATAKK
jgi:hypothetical protein